MRTSLSRWLQKTDKYRTFVNVSWNSQKQFISQQITQLEDRVVPTARPLPLPTLYVGAGVGQQPIVRTYDYDSGLMKNEITVYESSFKGGVRVAAGDINLDKLPDLIVAPGPGGGPRIQVYNYSTGKQFPGSIGSFWAYEPNFRGGVNIAVGDVNGDRYPDIIAAAGPGGGPRIRIFSGKDASVLGDFFAYDPDFRGGISVAAGDMTKDGKAEIIVGAGKSGGPHVKVYDLSSGSPVVISSPVGNFMAFDSQQRGGVNVACGDVDGDGQCDVIVGEGVGQSPMVRVFSGSTGSLISEFQAFDQKVPGGLEVSSFFVDNDSKADIAVGTGQGVESRVRVFSGTSGNLVAGPLADFQPMGSGELGGIFIAASNDPPGTNPASVENGQVHDIPSGLNFAVEQFQQTIFTVRVTGYSTSDPSPTGTVTFFGHFPTTSDLSGPGSDEAIISAELIPVSPGVSEAKTGIVPNRYHRSSYYTWIKYGGDGYYQESLSAPDIMVVTNPPTVTICDCSGMSGEPLNNQAPSPAMAGGVRAGAGTFSRSIPGVGTGSKDTSIGWLSTDPDGMSIFPRLAKQNGAFTAFDAQGSSLKFDQIYDDFLPRSNETAIFGLGTPGYHLKKDDGTIVDFYGFDSTLSIGKRGTLAQMIDPKGNKIEVIDWNSNGRPTVLERTSKENGVTITEDYEYTYDSTGNQIVGIDLQRKQDSGSFQNVRSVGYDFGSSSYGPDFANVKDQDGTTLETTYTRYGDDGLLKYHFSPSSYDRLVADLGSSVSSLTDEQVAPYADTYAEYQTIEGQSRVSKIVNAGAGCSSCSAGQGVYTYEYLQRTAAYMARNEWAWKTTETLPDGNQNIYFTNQYGDLLLKSHLETASGQKWDNYYEYDDAGRVILEADPSTVTGYDESYPDLVHYVAGNAEYLADNDGKVTVKTYYSNTTADSVTAGGVTGYPEEVAIRRGEAGTDIPQEMWTYFQVLSSDSMSVPVATDTRYRNSDGTGSETTNYSYTWVTGTTQLLSSSISSPAVTTAENGPGSSTSTQTVNDSAGRPIWYKDAGGFLTYTQYDPATGAVIKTISDVDTTQTSTFTDLPSGWSTPTGGGLHLTTTYEVDILGRSTKMTYPNGRVDYTVYNDVNHEVRSYPAWNASTNTPTGPISVSRDDLANGYTETLTMSATPDVSAGRPTGTESISNLQSLSRSYRNAANQAIYTDSYYDFSGMTYSTTPNIGTQSTNFYRTSQGYNDQGQLDRSVSAAGTITRTVYDGLNRAISFWIGTDDTPTTDEWDPTNTAGTDLVKVQEMEYDNGDVGDGNVTKVTQYPGGGATPRVTQTFFDWRDRAVAVKSGVESSESSNVHRPIAYTTYDNLGEATISQMYDGDGVTITDANSDGIPDAPSASLLRAQTMSSYDELGRVYRTDKYSVNPSTGSVSTNALHNNTWYDNRGNVIKTASLGGLVQKTQFDGAGRTTVISSTDGGGDSSWSDASNVSGDIVLEQTETTYDANSNVILSVNRQRFHAATGTGTLGTPTTGVPARVSYVGTYYDNVDRLIATVNVGTNGGTAWTRPSSVPTRSDTVLINSTSYDAAGRSYQGTDPMGRISQTSYDSLGRTTQTVENVVSSSTATDTNKTTDYTYGPAGMTSLTAETGSSSGQTTQWVYGVTTASGSAVDSNDIVGQTWWPDPTTGAASSSQADTVTVNALGQTITSSDRNGNIHTLDYDVLGRLTSDTVTTLGTNVDGSIRRVETAYDGQGNAYLLTNYDATSGGSVATQVQRQYNGLGQLVTEYQSHSGEVNTSTTPKVQYSYSEMASGANHSRQISMTYPNGRVIDFNYGVSLDDSISRLSAMKDGSTTLESYDYLGLGTVVRRAHPQPGTDLTYIKQSGESNGDAGDQYTGLDRFGRVVDQRWITTSTGTAVDRYEYGYDRNGNRTFRDNMVNSSFGELYAYDGLNQMAVFQRGTLNSTRTAVSGTASRAQSWNYDPLGNFNSQTTDGTTQTRTANNQNEITSISGATTPTYDSNGNMTTDETGKQFVFDAWNRLVIVKSSGGIVLESNKYDARGYRVAEVPASGSTIDLYYSANWQVLEERLGGVAKDSYVWSPVYIDAMIARDRDADGNTSNGLEERLYSIQDANWNVTGELNVAGTVVERMTYDAFGTSIVLDSSFVVISGGTAFAWAVLFQGYWLDSLSDSYYARNRNYNPTLGIWDRIDPIRFGGGDVDLYAFVGNNPEVNVDPTGTKVVLFKVGAGPSGSAPWHIGVGVIDERNDCVRAVQFNGGGPGPIALGQLTDRFPYTYFKGTPSNDQRIGPYRTPSGAGEWQANSTIKPDRIVATISDADPDQELKRLDAIYPKLHQPIYYSLIGPNSNTYARQLLTLAGFVAPEKLPVTAPGWVYSGDLRYGGAYFTEYGIVKDSKKLEAWRETFGTGLPYEGFPIY